MPPSSNPTPRRSRPQTGGASRPNSSRPPGNSGGAPRSRAAVADRTLDLTEPMRRPAPKKSAKGSSHNPNDVGVRRREQKKQKNRRTAFFAWSIVAVVTVVIAGMGAGVLSELRTTEGRVGQKQGTLADLKAQLEIGKKRLQALNSASGKERVLTENGFVKPGQRFLYGFEPTPKSPN